MGKKKLVSLIVVIGCIIVIPLVILGLSPVPYGPRFRSSEFISDYFDYDLMILDSCGKAFKGFKSEFTASITLYSLYLGEVEVLFPIENMSEVAGRILSIGSNVNETIRPFMKYPGNITFYGLQGGEQSCQVTLPSKIDPNASFGIRQLMILNFSTEDLQHLISFMVYTENRSFAITKRLFLCPELQFIRIPDCNPFVEEYEITELGSEIRVKGEAIFVDYPLRLSDSFRQLQYYGNSIRNTILIFAVSIAVSSATLSLSLFQYFTKPEEKPERTPNGNDNHGAKKQQDKQNDFLDLVKNNRNIDEKDLRILLEKRIERPSKVFFEVTTVSVLFVLALISIQAFYTLPGFVVGLIFMIYIVIVLWGVVKNVTKNERRIMGQYLEAKALIVENRKDEQSTTENG